MPNPLASGSWWAIGVGAENDAPPSVEVAWSTTGAPSRVLFHTASTVPSGRTAIWTNSSTWPVSWPARQMLEDERRRVGVAAVAGGGEEHVLALVRPEVDPRQVGRAPERSVAGVDGEPLFVDALGRRSGDDDLIGGAERGEAAALVGRHTGANVCGEPPMSSVNLSGSPSIMTARVPNRTGRRHRRRRPGRRRRRCGVLSMKPITSGSLQVCPPSSVRQNSCGSSETIGNEPCATTYIRSGSSGSTAM